MDRFTVRIRESKYSDRCALHTSDITSSQGVRRTSRLKRALNQRSRASLRVTERELNEALLGSDKATKLFADMTYYQQHVDSLTTWLSENFENQEVEDYDFLEKRNECDEYKEQVAYLQGELDRLTL